MDSDLPVYGFGVRHVQVALIIFMVIIMYTINMLPAVGIVAMTNPGVSPNPNIPSFPYWTDQSLILISYYWGSAPSQLLGGPLARKYGLKWFMVLSMLISSFISICIPALVIQFGSGALMASFFAQGLCQGMIIPMLSDFISIWAPVSERTTLGTFIFASKTLGTVFATEIPGVLSSSWWGWPSTFFLCGLLGFIWTGFMIVFGCNYPDEHKTISQSELEYIKRGKNFNKKKVPWSKILRSVPTWSTWIAQIGITWSLRLSTTEFPTYINRVLRFSVTMASNFLSITYLVAYFSTFLMSSISQYLINKNYLSTGTVRILCNTLACWGTALALVLLATFTINRNLGLVIIFFLFMCTNTGYCGYYINYNDLSPNYSGCIYGVGGVAATIISFAPTTLVQFMVTNQEDSTQWGHAFYLAAFITSVCNILFIFRGSGEVQDWDDPEYNEDDESRALLDKSLY